MITALFAFFTIINVRHSLVSNETNGDSLLNDTLSPITTNIYTTNSFCDKCVGEIKCGDTLNGQLNSSSDIDYFYFIFELNGLAVSFDSCGSDYDTYLYLFDLNYNELYTADDNGTCDVAGELLIYNLQPNEYILGISGYGSIENHSYGNWSMDVVCQHISVNYISIAAGGNWFEAEMQCENMYGTSLATIINEDNMIEAMNFNHSGVWVGLFRNILNATQWQWIDGTTCKYTENAHCMDHIPWADGKPDIESNEWQIAVYLSNGRLYDDQVSPYDHWGILCNAPGGTYSIQPCLRQFNCWKQMDCCDDTDLLYDTLVGLPWRHPIVFWNATLFVIGRQAIHYTKIQLFNNMFSWKNKIYTDGDLDIYDEMESQRYAQHKSLLYLLLQTSDYTQVILVKIDLNNLNVDYYIVPPNKYDAWFGISVDQRCLIATADYVYLYRTPYAMIFNVNTTSWELSEDFTYQYPLTCALTNDHRFIYIFPYEFVQGDIIKYDLIDKKYVAVNASNPCNNINGESRPRAVTGGNNKIYIHGCDVASWKTLIFDPKTEQFETNTINIDIPSDTSYYRQSQLTVFDDNVLLFMSSDLSLYYAITELISINVTETLTELWPSDGFYIKYYLNDFTNTTNNNYIISLYSANTTNIINETILLNTSNDNCLCHDTIYNCHNCSQYFQLQSHLSLTDNDLDTIQFYITPLVTDATKPLILPEYFTIKLRRCVIEFDSISPTTTTHNPSITFRYNLSMDCHARIKQNYSLNITAESVNIYKTMLIRIKDEHTLICKVCDMGMKAPCKYCGAEFFMIKHDAFDDDVKFNIEIESNMIDFRVVSTNATVQYLNKRSFWDSLSVMEHAGLIAAPMLFILFTIIVIGWFCRRHKILIRRQTQHQQKVYNPMVVCVGIAFYMDDARNAGIDLHCDDLDGINIDYLHIKQLCKLLNYDIYPNYEKYEWTEREIITFLKERAEDIGNKNKNKYDSILLVFSGHGYKNKIITSDYQFVDKTAIHRLFSTNYPSNRLFPRVFIFDSCDGDQQRSHYRAVDTDTDDNGNDEDIGKNFVTDDIEIKQYEEEIWKRDQKNPDYKLSLIHGANDGFQAKINSIDGSYLIYQFVKRMLYNIENKKELFLGEIIDGIQECLHDSGKQQIKSVFNNHTQYLKFRPNNKQNDNINQDMNNSEMDGGVYNDKAIETEPINAELKYRLENHIIDNATEDEFDNNHITESTVEMHLKEPIKYNFKQ